MNTASSLDKQKVSVTKPSVPPRNIDGFFRGKPMPSIRPAASKPHVSKPITRRNINHAKRHAPQTLDTIQVRSLDANHATHGTHVKHLGSTTNNVKHRSAQSSTTLMRRAVARPKPSLRKQVNASGTLQHKIPSLIHHTPSIGSIEPGRLVHSHSVSKNPLVSHHGKNSSVTAQFAPIQVQTAPKPHQTNQPPASVPAPHSGSDTPTNIFEQAMANAENYIDIHARKASFKKHRRSHALSMAAGTFALLLITAFAFYQNSPGVQFKVASVRAGVSTHMPNFAETGFAYTSVKTQDGKLVIGFSGVSGNYHLSQQSTNMSSNDMISSIGSTDASGNPSYQTVQAGNTTIYRFSNVEATWVSNGTWYTVSGTGPISNDQVIKLAHNV